MAEDRTTISEDQPTIRGLRSGQKVGAGRFVLKQLLGQGGMGIVWLAQDVRLSEEVALKFLPTQLRLDAGALDDLRQETKKSRLLAHQNIIRIHDLYEGEGDDPFISMEFVDGPTLSARRAQQPVRVLEWEYLSPLVRQLCDALEYAHNSQVIHRDLKPANLMVNSTQALKLADFGIARVVTDSVTRITMRQGTSGTLVYMSPQQLDGHPSNCTDDIYSVGATLYELLTSKPPFYTGEIAHQIRYVKPEPLTTRLTQFRISKDAPAAVEEAIASCLAKNPMERPQSARELSERLGLVPKTKRLTTARQEEPVAPEVKKGRWQTLALGLAVVVSLIAVWMASQNKKPQQTAAVAKPSEATNIVTAPPAPAGNGLQKTNLTAPMAVTSAMPAASPLATLIPTASPQAPTLTPATSPMRQSRTPREGAGWTNSLGMRFLPLANATVLLSVWDTRVMDYSNFVAAAGYTTDSQWSGEDYNGLLNPVVYVDYEDAQNFCDWLTKMEKGRGLLAEGQKYRLPTDLEWSWAVGLTNETGSTPKERSGGIKGKFAWGTDWPPPFGAGNFGRISGYHDDYRRTAPVGTFAGMNGFYDLTGNAWQWCQDEYGADGDKVTRGGSWDTRSQKELQLSHRKPYAEGVRDAEVGFRCVLDPGNAGIK